VTLYRINEKSGKVWVLDYMDGWRLIKDSTWEEVIPRDLYRSFQPRDLGRDNTYRYYTTQEP
jgi:hypothetical protein